MFERFDLPWIEFTNLATKSDPTLVRADFIVGFEKGDSGVNILLLGGGVVRVSGTVKAIREQIDAFLIEWEVGEEKRREERWARLDAAKAARGDTP